MAFPHDGRKFEKGKSGNPKGAPRGKQFSTILKELLEGKIKTTQGLEITRAEAAALEFFKRIFSRNMKDSDLIRAIQVIADITEKKQIDITSGGESINKLDMSNFTTEELKQIIETAAKSGADTADNSGSTE